MKAIFARIPDPVKYGGTAFVVVWFAGWFLAQGGFWPNLIFAAAMGVFAGVLFWLVTRFGGRGRE